MIAYYNENDPFAVAWLRELISEGLIADGEVDQRDIRDVVAADLAGFRQHHFFAGIGGWSFALRLAGWPDDRSVWTGSCPCQPFSVAGKGVGTGDGRHLWPAWFSLISECRPAVVFGEQVEAAIRFGWLDLVSADLESCGYAVGATVLPAGGVEAPHIRSRLWFVADAGRRCTEFVGLDVGSAQGSGEGEARQQRVRRDAGAGGAASGLADSEKIGCGTGRDVCQDGFAEIKPRGQRDAGRLGVADGDGRKPREPAAASARHRDSAVANGGVGNTEHGGCEGRPKEGGWSDAALPSGQADLHRPWSSIEWLYCRDGKWRPTRTGLFPLAHGVPNRVGTLRGAGNAIVPQGAAAFIEAYLAARAA